MADDSSDFSAEDELTSLEDTIMRGAERRAAAAESAAAAAELGSGSGGTNTKRSRHGEASFIGGGDDEMYRKLSEEHHIDEGVDSRVPPGLFTSRPSGGGGDGSGGGGSDSPYSRSTFDAAPVEP